MVKLKKVHLPKYDKNNKDVDTSPYNSYDNGQETL